jgi:hypothetical protein
MGVGLSDIFIVGPARSGTSWLQTVLAEHPNVASPPETGLFVAFIGPMERFWRQHRAQLDAARAEGTRMNVQGMATVVTSDDMLCWYRDLYRKARARVLAEKPGATRLLEKTPDHALYLDLIWRVVPDARVVFLVRDPRATVRSMLQASSEPWGHWAPTTVEGAAGRWLRNVQGPLKHRDDPRVLTVRYEDLRRDDREIARVAKFLELNDPAEWMVTPFDASPRERQANIVVAGEAANERLQAYELEGFSFHDRKQERELTRYERAYVETVCATEMEALGYGRECVRPPVGFRAIRAVRFPLLRGRYWLHRYRRKRARQRIV